MSKQPANPKHIPYPNHNHNHTHCWKQQLIVHKSLASLADVLDFSFFVWIEPRVRPEYGLFGTGAVEVGVF